MKSFAGIFIFLLFTFCACRTQKPVAANKPVASRDSIYVIPYAYFPFERAAFRKAGNEKSPRTYERADGGIVYNQSLSLADSISPVGACWKAGNTETRQTIMFDNAAVPMPKRLGQFTWEVALRFDPDSMDTYRMGFAEGQITISPSGIVFALVDSTGKADKKNRITISGPLAAATRQRIYDGKWHHFAFRFSIYAYMENEMRIWIDGATSQSFSKRLKNVYHSYSGNRFTTGFLPKTHSTGDYMDELALWNTSLAEGIITLHSIQFFNGEHYHFGFASVETVPNLAPPMVKGIKQSDEKTYAPGYPEYSVSQLEQLQSFPLPRYKPGSALPRNFPWFDFMYLSYDYAQAEEDSLGHPKYPNWKGPAHAASALALDTEMYYHWNYLFHIPSPTYQVADFARPQTISGKLTLYADQHPEIQTSTILFWSGVNPSRAGFESKRPYILKNASIDPCGDTSYPLIAMDGQTQKQNLELVFKNLPHRDPLRKIDFINENGEVFGESHTPNAEGYRGSPFIRCVQRDSLRARRDRAQWQYEVFSTYSSQFAGTKSFPALQNSKFSFYQVSAIMPPYYSEWRVMKKVNTGFGGNFFSTPDFYPGNVKWNIWETHGPYHGLDVIEAGREDEIKSGDPYFSPFVCAGWFADSLNFRAAEWLAAMKALGMMGAEFYYPAYFNTANPNKKQPQDPRGYVYQIAIPAYAQAITSRYEDIFFHSRDFVYQRNYNRLLIYRADSAAKKGERYAIFTALLSKDSVADFSSNNIKIGNDILKVNFPVQGATYIYDKTNPNNIVFYQLDAWHEVTHPYYWSKDFVFEAELHDDSTGILLHTECPAGAVAGDYTQFTTYISFTNAGSAKKQLTYNFEPRNDTGKYYVWIRARSTGKSGFSSSVKFSLDNKNEFVISGINSPQFQWYCYSVKGKPSLLSATPNAAHELKLISADASLELDKIILSTTKIPAGINTNEISGGTPKQ